jgi:hypothetical protein
LRQPSKLDERVKSLPAFLFLSLAASLSPPRSNTQMKIFFQIGQKFWISEKIWTYHYMKVTEIYNLMQLRQFMAAWGKRCDFDPHQGDCYRTSYARAESFIYPKVQICHGWTMGRDAQECVPWTGLVGDVLLGHAWCEDAKGYVYDLSNNLNVIMPKEEYYNRIDIHPETVARTYRRGRTESAD